MKRLAWAIVVFILALPAAGQQLDGARDQFGRPFRLCNWAEDRFVVVTFLGVHCPLGGLYANRLNELHEKYAGRGVCFVAVSANRHDNYDEVVAFARPLRFPMIEDPDHRIANELGATHSPEVFLLDCRREILYQGRIDDHYAPGVHGRGEPTRRDLEMALGEALSGQRVSVAVTEPVGCRIDRDVRPTGDLAVTYSSQIARILDARCAECHRPGEAAPFSLLDYDDAVAWRETIRDVITQKRMPPWGVRGGHFVNDRSLTDAERQLILAWLDAGVPEGDPALRPPPPKFATGWSFVPDRVLSMARPFAIPKEGVLDYQEFVLEPGFTEDTWVRAVEIHPGNRAVVHHINVYLKPKNALPEQLFVNSLGDYYLAMAVPGNSITTMPEGMAKVIPAGWNIVLSIHYVPNGTPQTDTSSIALSIVERSTVRKQVATRALLDDSLVIQPFEKKVVEHTWHVDDDYTLFALYPHMHWRGRSMLFTAHYPSGEEEVLLDVAAFDFAWQYRYVLSEPKNLPRGTVITARALYDNSAANPNNPNPAAVVRAGRQTTDEMFQACFEICRTHEDLAAESRHSPMKMAWCAITLAVAACVWRRLVGGRAEAGTGRKTQPA